MPNVAVEAASSWPVLLSALIGSASALLGIALGYYIQNRGAREERSWQRKSDAYVDLIGLMHRYGIELRVLRGNADAPPWYSASPFVVTLPFA